MSKSLLLMSRSTSRATTATITATITAIATAISALLLTAGCAQDLSLDQNVKHAAPTGSFKISRWYAPITPDGTATVQVFSAANQPIANARILIGHAEGSPFKNNFITTDAQGFVSIPEWKETAHVTVDAQGFIRQTLLNQKPGILQVKLNESYKTPRPVIKGQVTQLPITNGDKQIDFGLVIPTVTKADLINFDLGTIISPYDDTISIIGIMEASLPSNVSLPSQKESYLLPITLSKPEHRVYTTSYGPKTYYALSGRFPFKTVVDELQGGKLFFEVLNYFNFTTGGLREITVSGPQSQLNIPGNEIKFDGKVSIKGSAVQADEVIMALAMNDISGRYIPSDVKRLNTNQLMSLNIINKYPTQIVSVLKKQKDFDKATADTADRSSASIMSYKPNMQTSLLPLMTEAPVVTYADESYTINIPETPATTLDATAVSPIAISLSISQITQVQDGATKVSLSNRQWEVVGLTENSKWPTQIQLPKWPLEQSPTQLKKKFEVNLLGSSSVQDSIELGDDLIETTTHVTHAAAEL